MIIFVYTKDTLDGRKAKSLIKSDGPNKFVQEQRDPASGSLVTTIVREVVGEQMVQVNLLP